MSIFEKENENKTKCIVFEPSHQLRDKVSGTDVNFVFDAAAIQKAEKALEELSENFDDWIKQEIVRLEAAKETFIEDPLNYENIQILSRVCHDLKGHAQTFGYPMVTEFCISLGTLMENYPEGHEIPGILVQQHVDAVKAIIKQQIKTTDDETAKKLLGRLKFVTHECIEHCRKKNQD